MDDLDTRRLWSRMVHSLRNAPYGAKRVVDLKPLKAKATKTLSEERFAMQNSKTPYFFVSASCTELGVKRLVSPKGKQNDS
jgi:hypothetical protein